MSQTICDDVTDLAYLVLGDVACKISITQLTLLYTYNRPIIHSQGAYLKVKRENVWAVNS